MITVVICKLEIRKVFQVDQTEPSGSFKDAWSAAGRYIQARSDERVNWLRADLYPPLAEHLSFRLGNQLFFIYVDAAEWEWSRGREQFMQVAGQAKAIPCLMKMDQGQAGWKPRCAGWGLVHAESGEQIVPPALASDDFIEMSIWELHDFSIQVVGDYLKQQGNEVLSRQSSLEADPSIWFQGEQGPGFVVVRAVTYPETEASMPENIAGIQHRCRGISRSGFFASVAVANAENLDLPPYRGHGMHVRFTGLLAL